MVTGAGTLKVWRNGDQSKTLNARIVASSECLDLAVVKIDGNDLPYIGFRERSISTADEVYAAGFPLGDPTFTMTKGIVSKADTPADTPWASLDHVIEHDARIRGGNSGGPLVDPDGKLVGVNYAGDEQHDTNLAIHRDEVQKAAQELQSGKNILSLGINGEALVDESGAGLGIWVNSIASGSAADKAGVEPGDLLTSMEGVSLGSDGTLADYCSVLQTHGQESTLAVEAYRPSSDSYLRGQFNGDPFKTHDDCQLRNQRNVEPQHNPSDKCGRIHHSDRQFRNGERRRADRVVPARRNRIRGRQEQSFLWTGGQFRHRAVQKMDGERSERQSSPPRKQSRTHHRRSC